MLRIAFAVSAIGVLTAVALLSRSGLGPQDLQDWFAGFGAWGAGRTGPSVSGVAAGGGGRGGWSMVMSAILAFAS